MNTGTAIWPQKLKPSPPPFSYIFLSIPIYWNTAVAIAIVSYAVVLYARNPMKQQQKAEDKVLIPFEHR